MTDEEDRIGTADAAEILGWSQRKVQRAVTTGAIPIVGRINVRGDALLSRKQIEELKLIRSTDPDETT